MTILRVYWTFNNIAYAMTEVTPKELEQVKKRRPNEEGIPMLWAQLSNGDFDWFPDCHDGEPCVERIKVKP